jgi:hypothetical protein
MNASSIAITEKSLKPAAALLHDARFIADTIEYNTTKRKFSMKCWIRVSAKGEKVWKAHSLEFSDVDDCKITQKEIVSYYELATLNFNKNKQELNLVTHYAIEIILKTDGLNGLMTESGESRKNWVK